MVRKKDATTDSDAATGGASREATTSIPESGRPALRRSRTDVRRDALARGAVASVPHETPTFLMVVISDSSVEEADARRAAARRDLCSPSHSWLEAAAVRWRHWRGQVGALAPE